MELLFWILFNSRPWLCYWILHSIALLGDSVDDELEDRAIDFLDRCQDKNGGYGGGPGQLPHLATTYAAVNSLVTLGGQKSLSSINRWMHDGGEIDVRACYTAISVASILNILDDELIENVGNYILSCQTYEGGIAGEPGSEAHGGYTFCGLATMILIKEVNRLDLASLTDWLVFRQGLEGGFQGRTNKLVDGCYSFWQGGASALIQRLHMIVDEQAFVSDEVDENDADSSQTSADLSEEEQCLGGNSPHADEHCSHEDGAGQRNPSDQVKFERLGVGSTGRRGNAETEPLFHCIELQRYILLCSQVEGGFRDKPGKYRDHYHTCYCLSGLSVCQYSWSSNVDSQPLPAAVFGNYSKNLLEPVHPVYNVVFERYKEAREFFMLPS
uniref:Protein farnesyltransferase subunit beta n=1 Tax=Daucus carota subsp. sativus TaxID=79200 RepID=A0A165WRE6_DAUCS